MKKLFYLPLILVVLLSGCVHYNEHIDINKDGSGLITFKIGLSDINEFFDADLRGVTSEVEIKSINALEKSPGITVIDSKNYTNSGIEWSEITLEYRSIKALVDALEEKVSISPGEMTFTKEDDYYLYKRTLPIIDLGYAEDLEPDFDAQIPTDILNLFLADTSWSYVITFPSRILETNALNSEVDAKNNTIHWIVDVADLFTTGKEMWAKIAL